MWGDEWIEKNFREISKWFNSNKGGDDGCMIQRLGMAVHRGVGMIGTAATFVVMVWPLVGFVAVVISQNRFRKGGIRDTVVGGCISFRDVGQFLDCMGAE
jgi:hypothetical protein